MHLFVRKYLPIYKIDRFIDIGIYGTNLFLQIDYNNENLILLENLLNNGIELKDVKINKLYERIHAKGLLSEFDTSSLEDKSLRNSLFMNFLKIENNSFQEILTKKILLFGAGAAGGVLAYLLAQFGYRNIIVVDDDIVNISDVYKTVIYKKRDVEMHKVIALNKHIEENFDTSIKTNISAPRTREEIKSLIEAEEPDLVIKACDPDLSFRYYLNEICFEMKIPFVYMSYSFERLNIGPFFVPGITKSDNELEKAFTKTCGAQYSFLNHRKLFYNYTIHPSISFNINILANIVLKEIVFFHLKKFEYVFSLNKEVFFFPLTMRVFFKDLNTLQE